MTLSLRFAVLITASLAAIACGGGSSPTAPSPVTTTPATTTTTTATTPPPAAPAPAPAPASLTGTWSDGFSTIQLTQNGSSLSGTQTPYSVDFGGLIATFSGPISGSVSGANVTMTLQVVLTVRGFGDALTCRGSDSFAGQASGTTLTGTYTPVSSPYVCDGGIPLPLPPFVSGGRVYSRQ